MFYVVNNSFCDVGETHTHTLSLSLSDTHKHTHPNTLSLTHTHPDAPEMAVPTSALPPVDVRLTPSTSPAAADTRMDTTKLKP
jgi:hypothetical protein